MRGAEGERKIAINKPLGALCEPLSVCWPAARHKYLAPRKKRCYRCCPKFHPSLQVFQVDHGDPTELSLLIGSFIVRPRALQRVRPFRFAVGLLSKASRPPPRFATRRSRGSTPYQGKKTGPLLRMGASGWIPRVLIGQAEGGKGVSLCMVYISVPMPALPAKKLR